MDLEKRLRDSRPELRREMTQLNASVLAALAQVSDTHSLVRQKPHRLVSSILRAFVQYPLPVLTACSLLISLALLQLGSTFGFSDWLMQQAGSIVFR